LQTESSAFGMVIKMKLSLTHHLTLVLTLLLACPAWSPAQPNSDGTRSAARGEASIPGASSTSFTSLAASPAMNKAQMSFGNEVFEDGSLLVLGGIANIVCENSSRKLASVGVNSYFHVDPGDNSTLCNFMPGADKSTPSNLFDTIPIRANSPYPVVLFSKKTGPSLTGSLGSELNLPLPDYRPSTLSPDEQLFDSRNEIGLSGAAFFERNWQEAADPTYQPVSLDHISFPKVYNSLV